ncbi:MAG: hypothetical protein ABIQ44_03765 [Chloroflexia bacterium]
MLAVRLSEDKVSAIPIPDLGGSPTLSRLIQEAVVIVQRCEQADRYRNLRIVRAKACDAVLGGLLEQGGVDEELFETCLQGRRSSRCLLPVLLPLWNLASEGVPQQMVERLVPPSIAIGGIPAYAIDGYTAPGRVALARLGRLDSRLTRITSILSTPQKRLACLTSLLFVVEGGICSQELSDPLYEELKASSLGCWTGLSRRVLPQALEAMRIALPLLDQLRDEVLGDGV